MFRLKYILKKVLYILSKITYSDHWFVVLWASNDYCGLCVFSENIFEKKTEESQRRYPKRPGTRKNYTEGHVPNDDDYICMFIPYITIGVAIVVV